MDIQCPSYQGSKGFNDSQACKHFSLDHGPESYMSMLKLPVAKNTVAERPLAKTPTALSIALATPSNVAPNSDATSMTTVCEATLVGDVAATKHTLSATQQGMAARWPFVLRPTRI
jgi:hypothetical protein